MKNVALFVLFIVACSSGFAKRAAPKQVKSIYNAGLKYEVLHRVPLTAKVNQNGGYVRLINTRNGLPLCTKQVYETKYDSSLERDVQDNFITSIKIVKDEIIIYSEKLGPIKKSLANFCD